MSNWNKKLSFYALNNTYRMNNTLSLSLSLYTYIHIYIYIYMVSRALRGQNHTFTWTAVRNWGTNFEISAHHHNCRNIKMDLQDTWPECVDWNNLDQKRSKLRVDNRFHKIQWLQRLADKLLSWRQTFLPQSQQQWFIALPFSVQHPSRVTTLAWEPSCCIISNSLSKSSFSLEEAPSFTVFTATRRVVPSWPLMSSASAFKT